MGLGEDEGPGRMGQCVEKYREDGQRGAEPGGDKTEGMGN